MGWDWILPPRGDQCLSPGQRSGKASLRVVLAGTLSFPFLSFPFLTLLYLTLPPTLPLFLPLTLPLILPYPDNAGSGQNHGNMNMNMNVNGNMHMNGINGMVSQLLVLIATINYDQFRRPTLYTTTHTAILLRLYPSPSLTTLPYPTVAK